MTEVLRPIRNEIRLIERKDLELIKKKIKKMVIRIV